MALVLKDRVRETTTTQGTGTVTLAGAVAGFQSFSAIGDANTTYYTINLPGVNEWEVGIGTYTASGTTLSRDTVLASSNSGNLVNFSAGTKDVFCTYPAGRSVYYDTATNVTLNTLAATTIDTTNLEVTNVKAKDGTAAIVLTDSTGVATLSANPILNAGTANGVVYLNASKVATSGSGLVFDGSKLGLDQATVSDRITLGRTASTENTNLIRSYRGAFTSQYSVWGNSGGVTYINTEGGGGTVWYVDGTEKMRLGGTATTGGVGALGIGYTTLTSAGDSGLVVSGNVGIGTNAPGAKLDVVTGTTNRIRISESESKLFFDSLNAAASAWGPKVERATSLSWFTAASGQPTSGMILTSTGTLNIVGAGTAGSTQAVSINGSTPVNTLVTTSGGNVGIGTDSPATAYGYTKVIDIAGSFPGIKFTPSGASTFGFQIGAGTSGFQFYDVAASAERMRIDSSGNLGIGTSSPGAKLQVNGAGDSPNGSNQTTRIFSTDALAANKGGSILFGGVYTGSTVAGWAGIAGLKENATDGEYGAYLAFYTRKNGSSVAEAARLDASGNLGLGVTPKTDWATDYKAMQFGASGALSSHTSTSLNFTILATNQYVTSAGTSKFINDGYAPRYLLRGDTGEHYWYTTNTSTAGQNVTNTQAMTLDASGNLVVGATSTSNRFEAVAGTGAQAISTFRTGDSTAANNAGGGFYANSSATAGSRYAYMWLDADGANFSGSDYGYMYKAGNSGILEIGNASSAAMVFSIASTERARITSGGLFQVSSGGSVQVGGTAARATTAGTNRLDIFNGTAPVGTLTNGISIYSSSGEAYVMDAAGNATLFSPHDAETNEWIFKSKHTPSGKVLRIDVERLLRFVNDHFGLDAVKEFVEE